MGRPIQGKLFSAALIIFIVGTTVGGLLWQLGGAHVLGTWENSPLQRFTSYQQLRAFLNTTRSVQPYYEYLPKTSFGRDSSGLLTVPDYSPTNIQVEGVDEADIVKTDGRYVYLITGRNLTIIQAHPPRDAKVLARLVLNQAANGIYVNGDKLIVLYGGGGDYYPMSRSGLQLPFYYPEGPGAIRIYDISNRASPTLERNITIDGTYLSSRMLGDYVYTIVTKPAYLVNREVPLPTLTVDERELTISASSIYYANYTDYSYSFTTIVAVNVKDPSRAPKTQTLLLGGASQIYVSEKNIYITTPTSRDATAVHKISVEGEEISYGAHGVVEGYVLNQFSMDEYQDYFRVATMSWAGGTSVSNIYVLNETLGIVGRLEGLAPREQIHSARFMGDKCYLVTFKKVDPLFVIDLADPEKPLVLGQLKVPGYSDYLHPYDGLHLFGVGKETVEAKVGDFAWYQGVKLSLFDVSNVSEPREMAKVTIGDRGTDSPVLSDHRAFLFSWSKRLLVLPILLAEIDERKYPGGVPANAYGDYVWQGVYVFDVSLAGGIVLRGRVTHLEDSSELLRAGYYWDSPYSVRRSLYIGDVLYTVSDKMIMMNSLEDLELVGEVGLA